MSITIRLKPQIEAQLEAQANAQNISVEHLLEILVEDCLVSLQQKRERDASANSNDKIAIIKALGKSPSLAKAPSLSDEAIGRESIYLAREDAQL